MHSSACCGSSAEIESSCRSAFDHSALSLTLCLKFVQFHQQAPSVCRSAASAQIAQIERRRPSQPHASSNCAHRHRQRAPQDPPRTLATPAFFCSSAAGLPSALQQLCPAAFAALACACGRCMQLAPLCSSSTPPSIPAAAPAPSIVAPPSGRATTKPATTRPRWSPRRRPAALPAAAARLSTPPLLLHQLRGSKRGLFTSSPASSSSTTTTRGLLDQ